MFHTLFAAALASHATADHEGLDVLAEVSASLVEVDHERCEATVGEAFRRLMATDTTVIDAAFVAENPGAVDAVWVLQQQAWGTLERLHEDGPVGEGCVDSFRRLDLALRGAGDLLLMHTPDATPWLVTDELAGFDDLRSGDVLVTRGGALSSAGIAHIGAVDASFSHNAMVHIDAHGKAWTVEAYLEKGALVQPLEDFLAHGLGRVTVVRYEDEALAAKAAHLAYQRIAHGPAIGYDEAFDSEAHNELFCSEIVPWAFSLAGHEDPVPLHRTRFDHEATPRLFAGMGVVAEDLAAPADLLFDPRFRVVGAWRALDLLPELHRQDAVVDGLFRHLEATGRAPVPTWTHRATVDVGLVVRRTPGLKGLVKDMVHPDGDRTFLVAALALQDAGQRLYDAVWTEEMQGQALTRQQLDRRIDAVLADDASARKGRGRRGGVSKVVR